MLKFSEFERDTIVLQSKKAFAIPKPGYQRLVKDEKLKEVLVSSFFL